MKRELIDLYLKCRKTKPFMLVGSDAKCSLEAARTILAFTGYTRPELITET